MQLARQNVTLINSCWKDDFTGHGGYLEHLLLSVSQLKKKIKTNFSASKHFYRSSKSKMKVENKCFHSITRVLAVLWERLQRKMASLSPTYSQLGKERQVIHRC